MATLFDIKDNIEEFLNDKTIAYRQLDIIHNIKPVSRARRWAYQSNVWFDEVQRDAETVSVPRPSPVVIRDTPLHIHDASSCLNGIRRRRRWPGAAWGVERTQNTVHNKSTMSNTPMVNQHRAHSIVHVSELHYCSANGVSENCVAYCCAINWAGNSDGWLHVNARIIII